jgi:dockerin type I repeat protein
MRRVFSLGALLWAATAGPVRAQVPSGSQLRLFFLEPSTSGDTAYVTTAGGQVTVTIAAQDFNANSYALGAFTLRLYFDPARVSFVDARSICPDSVANPLNAPVTGANFVELSAPGCASALLFQHNVLRAHFALAAGAVDGSTLYLDPVVVTDRLGTDRRADRVGDVTEVCHASGLWGDVSNDGVVNSLDALITLSGAVGLSTGPYTLTKADVDGDGQVTSRDALLMLSTAIGLPTTGFRVNTGIVDACAPEATFPRPLYFTREGANPGVAGVSGLAIRAAAGTAVTVAGDSADVGNYDWRPRVSPDGSGTVLFICWRAGYPQICKANADGTGRVDLTPGDLLIDQSPDWSPAGDSIVFVKSNQIWVMAADGSNPHIMLSSPSNIEAVSWQPVAGSRTVAYANLLNSGEVHTVSLDDVATDKTVFASSATALVPRWVDWDQAGDSLLFDLVVDNTRVVAGAPAVAGGPFSVRLTLPGSAFNPAWTDQGVLFATNRGRDRLYVWRPDGSLGVIGRDPVGNSTPGMKRVP